jgi:hypothetical protein
MIYIYIYSEYYAWPWTQSTDEPTMGHVLSSFIATCIIPAGHYDVHYARLCVSVESNVTRIYSSINGEVGDG